MGWHTRHASLFAGLEGHLRPETLNLTAWNHALGLHKQNKNKNKQQKTNIYIYIYIYILYNIYNNGAIYIMYNVSFFCMCGAYTYT